MSFAETFRGTLAYAQKEVDENWEGPGSVWPVTMAVPESALPDISTVSSPPKGSQTISLKSIRAPKFSVEYTVPLSDSVYSLKERLLTDPSSPLPAGKYSPASMKLLIKSKVVSDTRQLAELPSTSFVVMFVDASTNFDVPLPAQIYWGDEAELINSAVEPKQPKQQTQRELPGINDQFWHEVEVVARKYVSDPKLLVSSLKSAIPPAEPSSNLDLD